MNPWTPPPGDLDGLAEEAGNALALALGWERISHRTGCDELEWLDPETGEAWTCPGVDLDSAMGAAEALLRRHRVAVGLRPIPGPGGRVFWLGTIQYGPKRPEPAAHGSGGRECGRAMALVCACLEVVERLGRGARDSVAGGRGES